LEAVHYGYLLDEFQKLGLGARHRLVLASVQDQLTGCLTLQYPKIAVLQAVALQERPLVVFQLIHSQEGLLLVLVRQKWAGEVEDQCPARAAAPRFGKYHSAAVPPKTLVVVG